MTMRCWELRGDEAVTPTRLALALEADMPALAALASL